MGTDFKDAPEGATHQGYRAGADHMIPWYKFEDGKWYFYSNITDTGTWKECRGNGRNPIYTPLTELPVKREWVPGRDLPPVGEKAVIKHTLTSPMWASQVEAGTVVEIIAHVLNPTGHVMVAVFGAYTPHGDWYVRQCSARLFDRIKTEEELRKEKAVAYLEKLGFHSGHFTDLMDLLIERDLLKEV